MRKWHVRVDHVRRLSPDELAQAPDRPREAVQIPSPACWKDTHRRASVGEARKQRTVAKRDHSHLNVMLGHAAHKVEQDRLLPAETGARLDYEQLQGVVRHGGPRRLVAPTQPRRKLAS